MQEKTRNGCIVTDKDKVHRKKIHLMETQLQKSKVKLSIARKDNVELRHRIDNVRRSKLLHLQIYRDMVRYCRFPFRCNLILMWFAWSTRKRN